MDTGLPWTWGATASEVERRYPADDTLAATTVAATRAVTVHAPTDLAYRWLCQVKVAPYSYDLIDNLGRRSPPHLTPGADQLAVGERMMVFELTDVQRGRQWTGVTNGWSRQLFGEIAATYAVEPVDSSSCRMLCRMRLARPRGLGRIRVLGLGWGDLVMMRRQLLNLKHFAERDASAAAAA